MTGPRYRAIISPKRSRPSRATAALRIPALRSLLTHSWCVLAVSRVVVREPAADLSPPEPRHHALYFPFSAIRENAHSDARDGRFPALPAAEARSGPACAALSWTHPSELQSQFHL